MATAQEQAKLEAFMSKGRSYPKADSIGGSSEVIADSVTDK